MAPIKINSASAAELLLLPGVGDTLAARIIKFRRRHVITGDNIYDINRLRATPALMAAISFEVDPSQQGPGPSGQGAGSRSSSSSSETGTRRSSRGAASGRQRGRRPQSPAYSRASGRQGTRQGSPSHHRSARSRRRTARHSSHSSLTSDSDASLSRSRRTGYRQQKETFRTPPRALDYDGKSDWATFYRRFTSYASEKDWSGPTSLTQLGWCLKGKASDFYNRLLDREPSIDYIRMMHKMIKRFGDREVLDVAMMKFNQAQQEPEEDIADWADRAHHLAHRAYKHVPRWEVEQIAVMRFGQGLQDKSLAGYISNARNSSMEEAIDRAQIFQHNAIAIHGSSGSKGYDSHHRVPQGPAVRVNAVGRYSQYERPPRSNDASRRSTLTLPSSPGTSPATSSSGFGINTCRPSSAGSHPLSSRGVEAKLDTLVAGISETNGRLDQVCESLRHLTVALMSPQHRRSPSPRRPVQCYRCGKEGHFARDCEESERDEEAVRQHGDTSGNKPHVSFKDQNSSLNAAGLAHSV
ncbi:uncharacterized protein [Procambarus clarkii]|uniref:uncharacterized protein n=1 Tax=Procambarus clarkii TaxID=6728 RepID=UPI00374213F3